MKRSDGYQIALVVVSVIVFYAVHLDPTRTAAGGDWANLFWPMKEFRNRALLETGEFPLWCPYVFMGMPFAATMQHAVFYPLDYVFAWAPNGFAEMNWSLLLHLVLAGTGAWWWASRGWRLSPIPAVAVGVLFPCTAWFWGHQEHLNQIAAAAWMPWLMTLVVQRARGEITRPAFVGLYGALSAMQLLVGHPQGAFYTHLFAGLLLMGRVLTSPEANRAGRSLTALSDFVMAGALAGLAAAIQLLPAMELSKMSYRQFAPEDPSYALTFSMPPDQLIGYLLPGAFGNYADGWIDRRAYNEYGVHVGRLVLMMGLIGVGGLMARRRWRTALALGGGIALTLLMALGGNASIGRVLTGEFSEQPASWRAIPAVMQDVDAGETPPAEPRLLFLSLHEALMAVIPPMRGFRAPGRVLMVTGLLWVTLAGLGLQAILSMVQARQSSPRWVLVLGITVVVGMFGDLLLASRGHSFRHPVDVASLLEEVEVDHARYEEATLDNRVWRFSVRDADLLVAERQRDTAAEVELEFENTPLWGRWMRLFENNNAVIRVASTHGYEEGLAPTVRTKDFFFEVNRNLRAFTPDDSLLALLGVSRVWTDFPENAFDNLAFPLIESESRGPRRVHDVRTHRGAAFWMSQVEGIHFARLDGPHSRGESPHPRGNNAPVDFGVPVRWSEEWPLLETDVSNPNRVVIKTGRLAGAMPGDALLTMGYSRDWFVEGEPVEWISAVHARVPAAAFGDGGAVLRYRPRSWCVGLFLSICGWAMLAALGSYSMQRIRRR